MKPRKGTKKQVTALDAVEVTDGLVLRTSLHARRRFGEIMRLAVKRGYHVGITSNGELDAVVIKVSEYRRLINGQRASA